MPYIPEEDRRKLDPRIDDLADRLGELAVGAESELAAAGLLNYACTRLALSLLRRRFGLVRYGALALVTGVFHNVADELYRRVASPYEEKQRAKNGDVDLYAELQKEIERL